MNIAIIAGGTLSEKLLPDIQKHNLLIGADRGAWWLLEHQIIPAYAIGDFDSVTKEELAIIKESSPNVVQYGSEKNETDLELAINLAISLQPTKITVFGATGTRLDQTLAGFFLLEGLGVEISVQDEHNKLIVIDKEKTIKKSIYYKYCSFISLTSIAVVTLEGFKYPLVKGILRRNKTLGISNELVLTEAKISVHKGRVLCIQSSE